MTSVTRDFATTGDGMIAPDAQPGDTMDAMARRAPRLRVPERMVLLSVAVLVAVVAVLTVTPWPVGAFQDDAMYTVLAKSLAEGHGYRFINLPGEPNATHFPPGYPLVLALLWKVAPSFPDNLVVFKFANAVFLALAAVGCHRFVRKRFAAGVIPSAVAGLAGTLSVVVLVVTGVVLSEPLFMALLFPALLAAERSAETGAPRDAAVAGAWLGALGLVRTVGAFGLPAAALVLVLRRRFTGAAALCVAGALFMLPWQWWVGQHQGEIASVFTGKYGAYGTWLIEGYRDGGLDLARGVVLGNLREIRNTLSFLILPIAQPFPRFLLLAALGVFAIAGVRVFCRRAPVTLAFLLLYMLVVIAWPFQPSRFLIGVWPLWLPLIGAGVLSLWQAQAAISSRLRVPLRSALVVAAVACASGHLWYNVRGYTHAWWASIPRDAGQRAKPIVEWVAQYTQPDDVLSTEDDLMVYLYAGRKSVPTATFTARERLIVATDEEHTATAREIFRKYQPDYYIINSRQGARTAEVLASEVPPLLRHVGDIATVRIYTRVQP
jgi:hypothetical protein